MADVITVLEEVFLEWQVEIQVLVVMWHLLLLGLTEVGTVVSGLQVLYIIAHYHVLLALKLNGSIVFKD